MNLSTEMETLIDRTVDELKTVLGKRLSSCILSGSPSEGDLTLLLVVEQSTVDVHASISDILTEFSQIEPLIVEKASLERTLRSMATHFNRMRQIYRVLAGADLFAGQTVDRAILHDDCCRALDLLQAQSIRAFLLYGRHGKRYAWHLRQITSKIFVALSNALRYADMDLPHEFGERVAFFEQEFAVEASILQDLVDLKDRPRILEEPEAEKLHGRVLDLIRGALAWLESRRT